MTEDVGHRTAATVERLCERLGHTFYDPSLLRRALTHSSFRNEAADVARDNQRLEFLGDSVLGLVVADRLFRAVPGADEGNLTLLKARCVSEPALAEVARRIRLGEILRLGRGERRRGGSQLDSVLADAMEAVLGAVFIDGGYLAAQIAVARAFKPELDQAIASGRSGRREMARISGSSGATRNWKTPLQELMQEHGLSHPQYEVIRAEGPPHKRTFTIEVRASFEGRDFAGTGSGASKKTASHEAAKALHRELIALWSSET